MMIHNMFIMEKKKRRMFFILLFITILSIPVLAEHAAVYWYDAEGNTCRAIELGAVPTDPNQKLYGYYSDAAPFTDRGCCDVEGNVQVMFYTTFGHAITVPAYDINWDQDLVDCNCHKKTWLPEKFFESNKPSCCGDDIGSEFYVTQGVGQPACCLQGGANACVSSSGKCRYEYGKETTCHDGIDNDCDSKTDCADTTDCKTGNETSCRDKIDNDCDGHKDCSDTDCGISLDCIGCAPETDNTKCLDLKDNDCDNYIDCVDSDCIDVEVCPCEPVVEICDDTKDNDCDGKTDCKDEDCFESCGGNCVAENQEKGNCDNGQDDDCDSFIDHGDGDCPGCNMSTKLCKDGSCKESCDSQACVSVDGICEEVEGCSCEDCLGKRDSCDRELICDLNAKTCKCPSGTTMCSDGKCRMKCFVCGNGVREAGEECDKNNSAKTTCPGGCTGGEVICKDDCTWDTSGCSGCQQCSPKDVDGYCCVIPGDGKCDDIECTANADSDCVDKCTPYPEDCCKDSKDGKCDPDCISYKDPDCSESCGSKKDNCCNAKSGNDCDSDCDTGIDPDCGVCTSSKGDCCNEKQDNVCDSDCISGVDPDCECGNGIVDAGETCDSTNLDGKTCDYFFQDYGGVLSCFDADEKHPCHFDTSGCYEQPKICTGGFCGFGKDCRCSECVGQQNGCYYGAVCDAVARCVCIGGTTLCRDGTCRTTENCKVYGGGEQLCLTSDLGGTEGCDFGEGCGCSDCEGKRGPCDSLALCREGICTGCFIKRAYWADAETGKQEDCVGSRTDVKLTVKGSPGCAGKIVTFKLMDEDRQEIILTSNKAEFKVDQAELPWTTETLDEEKARYKFEASLDGKEKIVSEELEVEYCIKKCDQDCDDYCENENLECQDARLYNNIDFYCKGEGGKTRKLKEDKIGLDANAKSGHCEECDENGLSEGQETCAAYYDCTSGWWGTSTPNGWTPQMKQEAMNYLEWGDCGESKVDYAITQLGSGRRKVEGSMRNRLICPPSLTKQQCCAGQASCYCEIPTKEEMEKKGLTCDFPEFRPTEVKACLAEEKFPFFTNTNILIVVLILVSFYIWKNREKAKTKK